MRGYSLVEIEPWKSLLEMYIVYVKGEMGIHPLKKIHA